MGGSFNRIPEAVWVFQISGNESDAKSDWENLVPLLFNKSLSYGIKPSSIRRLTGQKDNSLFSTENAVLENMIVHPSAGFLYVGGK
jgi:hypothetical protein